MKKVIYLMVLLLSVNSLEAQVNHVDLTIKNNACSIEQHLKEDSRLIGANKEIGFIQSFENESIDKKKVVSYPDISNDLLTLTPQLIFKVARSRSSPRKVMDTEGQEVGEFSRFEFVDVLDEKRNLTLDVYIYSTQIGYYYARDKFIRTVRATSMPFIPFEKGPADLGTVSFIMKEIYPFGQIVWVHRNIYFRVANSSLSEEAVLKIASWVQEQVKHPNQ